MNYINILISIPIIVFLFYLVSKIYYFYILKIEEEAFNEIISLKYIDDFNEIIFIHNKCVYFSQDIFLSKDSYFRYIGIDEVNNTNRSIYKVVSPSNFIKILNNFNKNKITLEQFQSEFYNFQKFYNTSKILPYVESCKDNFKQIKVKGIREDFLDILNAVYFSKQE